MPLDERGRWKLTTIVAAALVLWAMTMEVTARHTFNRNPEDRLPLGLTSPVLALELAPTVDDVKGILLSGKGCENVSALKLHLGLDAVFIGLYVTLLLAVGLIAGTASGIRRWVLFCLALGAGLADAVENAGLWEIATTITPMGVTRTVRGPALVKWTCFFAAVGFIAFLWARAVLEVPRWARQGIVGCASAAAALGAIGFLWPPAIAVSFVPMAGLLATVIVVGLLKFRKVRLAANEGDGAD